MVFFEVVWALIFERVRMKTNIERSHFIEKLTKIYLLMLSAKMVDDRG